MLLQALGSVLAQTAPLEVIIIDDGDGSGAQIARTLSDPRIRAERNPRKGQIPARHRALELAQGRFIAWLDDDDYWNNSRLLEQAQWTLQANPRALAYSGGVMVYKHECLAFHPKITPFSLRNDNSLLVGGTFYDRSWHAQLGGFDETLRHYWDWDWWLRLVAAGAKLEPLMGSNVCIRIHEKSESSIRNADARAKDLQSLRGKHGLYHLELKNHHTLALEQVAI